MYVCMYVCMYVERERERDRETRLMKALAESMMELLEPVALRTASRVVFPEPLAISRPSVFHLSCTCVPGDNVTSVAAHQAPK